MNIRLELIDRKTQELGDALELFHLYDSFNEVDDRVMYKVVQDLKEKALTLKYLIEEEVEVRKSKNESIPPKYLEALEWLDKGFSYLDDI